MKGRLGQEGFSFIEIMVSLLIVATVASYVAVKSRDNRAIANDSLAKSTLGDIETAANTCRDLYNAQHVVERTDSNQNVLECSEDGISSTGRKVLQLPERVRASVSSDWISVRHDDGTEGSSSDTRTTFCSDRNSSDTSVTETSSDSPLSAESDCSL